MKATKKNQSRKHVEKHITPARGTAPHRTVLLATMTAPTLEAIRYARGSLQLLDQLKLPTSTVFIDVPDCDACWSAIKEMNVRGAPAIAIAAALALAVEAHKTRDALVASGAAAVATFVTQKMDHLCTSRPTAVNLGEAVIRLKALADASVADGLDAAAVVDAVVRACEKMLEDDVAANMAIGAHGADALCAAVASRAADPARAKPVGAALRVLTHCNTGSLATAGYGTALGVVRALRGRNLLEHVYCNETRPYNQGARLTAYEIAFEKMPGTLICDSAAAALMAKGKVDAVVVGADRVADNGDTANKIGTYNLAVSCAYHGVPFFVAAPSTTLDANTATGADIVIEDRPSTEVTHSLGTRVAAEGIDVWNPSFDVTPGSLIEGIITESGVARKNADGAFEIGKFIRDVIGAGGEPAAAAGPPGFVALDTATVLDYCAGKASIADALGGASTRKEWSAKEVGDGNINFVYIVTGSGGNAVIVKQGLPYVRCVGEAWPLTQERVRYEAEALQTAHGYCPAHVPVVYEYDAPMSVIAMRYLEPPHIILRGGIISGTIYANLASHVGEYLATTLFGSSALKVGCEAQRRARAAFGQNEAMCALTEQVIFTEPYAKAENNHWTSPQLDDAAKALRSDNELKVAICALKNKFASDAAALLHGDLHTGSIMCTMDTTFVIDHEFAFYGPMGFDVGAFVANLLLAYFAQDGYDGDRAKQREWLLSCVKETWGVFASRFRELWNEEGISSDTSGLAPGSLFSAAAGAEGDVDAALRAHQDKFIDDVWKDTLGFAGAKMTRRIVGIAHVADLDSIGDADARARCETNALRCARRMILEAGSLSVDDVCAMAKELRGGA